jgi:hypothetical protein
MTVFLRVLACIYAFAALKHLANMLGFGELPWLEAPLAWQVSDVAYLLLDSVAAIGLFRLKPWGVAAFLLAAGSEILLFTLVPGWFVLKPEHAVLLQGFVIYHVIAIGIFALLIWNGQKGSSVRE